MNIKASALASPAAKASSNALTEDLIAASSSEEIAFEAGAFGSALGLSCLGADEASIASGASIREKMSACWIFVRMLLTRTEGLRCKGGTTQSTIAYRKPASKDDSNTFR